MFKAKKEYSLGQVSHTDEDPLYLQYQQTTHSDE